MFKLQKLASVILCVVLVFGAAFSVPIMSKAATSYVVNGVTIPLAGYPNGGASYGKGQCWAFAQMVYKKLWSGTAFTSYRGTSDDMLKNVASGRSRAITAANTKQFITSAKVGAVIRITDNINGNDSQGTEMHSMILVQKDSYGCTIYDSGNSGIHLKYYTWANFSSYYSKYKYFKYIKWPGSTPTSTPTTNPYSSTNPDSYTVPTRTLKYTSPTMKGKDVAWVQAVLKKLGYSITIDGSYGQGSVSVIKQFQSKYSMTVDGYCGPKTREKLKSLWNSMKHTHSYVTYYESAHPHKQYKKCSCGSSYYTGATQKVSSCTTCYPKPSKSTVTASKTKVYLNESVRISWTASANTNYYNLKYVYNNAYYTVGYNLKAGSANISFTVPGTYRIYVDSCNSNGYTQSNIVDITVLKTNAVNTNSSTNKDKVGISLLQPKVKVANASNGVNVSWNKIAGAKSYKVYRSTYSKGKWSKYVLYKYTTTLSYTDKNVKSGNKVRYTVYACNGSIKSKYKTGVAITFVSQPKVKVANASNGVKVSWSKIAGAKSYKVYRSTYSKGKWSKYVLYKSTTGLSYTDKNVKSGNKVRYTVYAFNGSINSKYKTGVVTTFISQPSVKSVKTTSAIKTTWNKIKGAKGYTVYRRYYSKGKWTAWKAMTKTTKLSYTDKKAKKGIKYQYYVRSYTSKYYSTYSKKGCVIKR